VLSKRIGAAGGGGVEPGLPLPPTASRQASQALPTHFPASNDAFEDEIACSIGMVGD
jgi:hypothetical protein